MSHCAFRPTFSSQYATPKNKRYQQTRGHRLGDCLLTIAPWGHKEFFNETQENEFCVIDTFRREKAWFEMPAGATPDNITAMIESHFDSGAFRIDSRIWFV